jgi:hypothetical protein
MEVNLSLIVSDSSPAERAISIASLRNDGDACGYRRDAATAAVRVCTPSFS